MTIETILSRLDKVRQSGPNRWTARCPAHDDKGPSLSLRDDAGKVLLHCFAGCDPIAVLDAIGVSFDELFPEPLKHEPSNRKPIPARDILECIALESKIVFMTGKDILADKPIHAFDWGRLKIAVSRIDAAWEESQRG